MIPYSCDAVLYHLPIVTGVLIALNIFAFVAALSEKIDVTNGWLLEYGTGLHPIQWLLSPFMHADFEHLLGNMLFLWTFGLVVEGKLGWQRFLAVYLGIAVGQSALEQAIFPLIAPDVPFTLGASAAIFGLVAMACMWAPVNELSIFTIFVYRVFIFEMSVGLFAALYVGLDVAYCFFQGTGAIGSATHLMGALLGAAIGLALLKAGAVECEDYDLLSVLSGTYGTDKKKQREALADAPEKKAARTAEQALESRRRIEAYLQINQPQQALAVMNRARQLRIPLELDRKELIRLIASLHQQKQWRESAPIMAELLQRFPDGSEAVRLKLAQICLVELEKPAKSLELLAGLNGAALPPQLESLRKKIEAVAKRKIDDGAIEVDDGQW